jgi:hypothetical protein
VHQQAVQVLEVQVSTDVAVQVIVTLHVKSGKWVQMQRCRGGDVVQRCRGAEVQRCRGAEVVQRRWWRVVQMWCVQRVGGGAEVAE